MYDFKVVAHTGDLNVYFVTGERSGYSVDNLAPIEPSGLSASVPTGSEVHLTWNPPSDPDVGQYVIYRSVTEDFPADQAFEIGVSLNLGYVDQSPIAGGANYYRIRAVDVHGNAGPATSAIKVNSEVTRTFVGRANWNLVSVPLTVQNYSKNILFPGSISRAFSYQGTYTPEETLKNTSGYWLKFGGDLPIDISGLLRRVDTIVVNAGWNLIGSISEPIAAGNVISIPPGAVTSRLFEYSGMYKSSDSIRPGTGYWMKTNQPCKLILSADPHLEASAKLRMVMSDDMPPDPPHETADLALDRPRDFALEQSYPNPFNPATTIEYSLPAETHVRLTVYNLLGQEVAVLVDEVQESGYKAVRFNGDQLSSGIYIYRINAGGYTETKRMHLIK